MWPFKKSKPVETSSKEELRKLANEIKEDSKKLSEKRKLYNSLTAKDVIEFTVTDIHRDRRNIIIDRIMVVDKNVSFKKFIESWNASAGGSSTGWFGAVKASGPKEKLVSVMHKIAKEGGTIIVDPAYDINIPPANKWWDLSWVIKMEVKRKEEKNKKKNEKKEAGKTEVAKTESVKTEENSETKSVEEMRKEIINKNKDKIDGDH